MSAFTDEEIEEFKFEAIELLDNAEEALLKISKGGDFRIGYETIFRCFHNLKGAAGMMELLDLQKHTHEVETIFTEYKDKVEMPGEVVDFFLRSIDGARSILNGQKIKFDYSISTYEPSAQIEAKKVEVKKINVKQEPFVDTSMDSAVDEFLLECDEIVDRVSKALLKLEKGGYEKGTVDELYRDVHSLKGASYLFDFKNIGDVAHAMESSMETLRNQNQVIPKSLIDAVYEALEVIEAEARCIKNRKTDPKVKDQVLKICEKFSSLDLNPEKSSTSVIDKPVNSETKEHELKKVSEPEVPSNEEESKPSEEVFLADNPVVEESPSKAEVGSSVEKESSGGSVRVSVQLLDKLMALMGEMVLVRNQEPILNLINPFSKPSKIL